jgi:hypothetical protein
VGSADEDETRRATMTTTSPRINATVTQYDGDAAFPEAAHYDEFCAERLAEQYPGYSVDVSFGLQTRAVVYDGDADQEDITSALKVDLWDAFCADGYKAYSEVL